MGAGLKKETIILKSGKRITVAKKNYSSERLAKSGDISYRDLEMDRRAVLAVKRALEKAKILAQSFLLWDLLMAG